MPHHCRDCRRFFSIKSDTVMKSSNVSYQEWAIATYLNNTIPKGISSMRMHRELDVTQTTAWFILKRLCKADSSGLLRFSSIVEVDESNIRPKVNRMNKKAKTKWDAQFMGARGAAGKIAVACARERDTGQVQFAVLRDKTGSTFRRFVLDHTEAEAEVQTDEAKQNHGLDKMDRIHTTVNHSETEFVRYEDGKFITTNGNEGTSVPLKRNILAINHRISSRHIHHYLNEGSGK